jgi:flagella basal body P-ring formation protein FlgA
MIRPALIILAALNAQAEAGSLVAARMVRSQSILGPGDIAESPDAVPGALTDPEAALGLEARVMLYPGRPIRAQDLGPPALVERNQVVALIFSRHGLSIVTDGRALDRAAAGERVRVMNLTSKTTVSGVVTESGDVMVGGK